MVVREMPMSLPRAGRGAGPQVGYGAASGARKRFRGSARSGTVRRPWTTREDALAAWEAIAPDFAAARRAPWPRVVRFLDSLPPGARVLDAGAGSGRHALAALERGLEPVALEPVRGFFAAMPPGLRARRVRGDAAFLPMRDASVDAVLLVAVLGTMPSGRDRVAALREARRVLRPGGGLLLTVWARRQRAYMQAMVGRGAWRRVGPGEVLAPWGQGTERVERPYHLYNVRGLRRDLAEAGWRKVRVRREAMAEGRGRDNLVVEAER